MTDRISSITLVLAADTRTDDAEQLMAACRQFGVIVAVIPNLCDGFAQATARSRLITELSAEFHRLLKGLG